MGYAGMKRKILYITGTRADYGLMRPVLYRIRDHPCLFLDIIVTGMHLMDEFGKSMDEITHDGFLFRTADVRYNDDTKKSMAEFIGHLISTMVPMVTKIQPDIILVLGDRAEMLAGAIVGVYLGIPVAHIHGGEVTSTVDDFARNAITKLAQIHFPATEGSRLRIRLMGEEESRIFPVGAPGLEPIPHESLLLRQDLEKKYQIDLNKPVLLVIQHPVSREIDMAPYQIRETLEAVVQSQYQAIIIYPNADSGGRAMIRVINEYHDMPNVRIYPNLPHRDFISLLRQVNVIIGNSSSGIIEAPSFGLPAINIGTRQTGRERGENVIDAGYDRKEIIECIDRVIHDNEFRERVKTGSNPYGDGQTSEKIVNVIASIPINDDLFIKKVTTIK